MLLQNPDDLLFGKPALTHRLSPGWRTEILTQNRGRFRGAGQAFGKAAAKIADHYVGIDYSPLALYIARIVSPENTTYLHISQVGEIQALKDTIDTVLGRHFFIHQNAANVEWILELYRHVLKDDGKAVLDFWLHPLGKNIKGATIRDGMGELSAEEASCVYYFSPEDIERLVKRAGFEIDGVEEVPEVDRRFVTISKAL